jgi:transposase
MVSAIELRTNYSVIDLRWLAAASKDANQCPWLLSLAAVQDGMNQTVAAKIGGMAVLHVGWQTLRDWLYRFNKRGPDGLKDNWHRGNPARLSAAQRACLCPKARGVSDPCRLLLISPQVLKGADTLELVDALRRRFCRAGRRCVARHRPILCHSSFAAADIRVDQRAGQAVKRDDGHQMALQCRAECSRRVAGFHARIRSRIWQGGA